MIAASEQVQAQLDGRAFRFPPVAPPALSNSFNVFCEPAARLQFAVVQRPVPVRVVLPAHLEQLPAVDAQSTTGQSTDVQKIRDLPSSELSRGANHANA